jgi:methyl-accepting chemotaxis protein
MVANLIKPSIARAAILPVAAILAPITGLAVVILVSSDRAKTAASLVEKASLTAQVVAPNAAAAAWNFDAQAGARVLQSLASDQDFASGIIVDDKSQTFATAQSRGVEAMSPGSIAALIGMANPKDLVGMEAREIVRGDAVVSVVPLILADKGKKNVGYMALSFSRERANAAARQQLFAIASGGLAALVAVCALLAWILARVTRPIREMTQAMGRLSAGQLDISIPALDRRDEIGAMAQALGVFKENANERQRLERSAQEEQNARETRRRRLEELIGAFRDEARDALATVVTNTEHMSGSADVMSQIAARSAEGAGAAAGATKDVSGHVQNVATAAEELSAAIAEIGSQVTRAGEVASEATTRTGQTAAAIEGLATQVEKIGEVVGLIQQVAEQTNLLALNATIEAARAGEAGRGFSVVASEVKALANQTARATEEISKRIGAIRSSTRESVAAIEAIAKTMSAVEAYSASIATSVEEQGAATAEIARNVHHAATAASSASTDMERLAAMVGETDRSAGEVRQSSGDVAHKAQTLQMVVDHFLREVAAA